MSTATSSTSLHHPALCNDLMNCPFIAYGCTARMYAEDIQHHCMDFAQNHIELLLCNLSLMKAQKNYANSAMSHAQTRCRQLEIELNQIHQENLILKDELMNVKLQLNNLKQEQKDDMKTEQNDHSISHPHPAADLNAKLCESTDTEESESQHQQKKNIIDDILPKILPPTFKLNSGLQNVPIKLSTVLPDDFDNDEYQTTHFFPRNILRNANSSIPEKILPFPVRKILLGADTDNTSKNSSVTEQRKPITTAVQPESLEYESPYVVFSKASNKTELYESLDTIEPSKLHQAVGYHATAWLCPHTYWERAKASLHVWTIPAAIKKHQEGDPNFG